MLCQPYVPPSGSSDLQDLVVCDTAPHPNTAANTPEVESLARLSFTLQEYPIQTSFPGYGQTNAHLAASFVPDVYSSDTRTAAPTRKRPPVKAKACKLPSPLQHFSLISNRATGQQTSFYITLQSSQYMRLCMSALHLLRFTEASTARKQMPDTNRHLHPYFPPTTPTPSRRKLHMPHVAQAQ
ncbi:hypothetical protein HBI81_042390 [Parastagonospora nodorum]|nr:hypothetical protein HBI02_151940 [Parastagonospora nodorum]KAH4306899.1 hypothetical protein HBI01_052960 [Parastagonospora nodorum]KAH4337032.1 hypothetical protein HBI00_016600 [Parastagonospora nodorum]KAH4382765.1 hypothetical protein HBH94_061140 [Parastagonospora nodorum]KAH4471591.1 hypothetical protein HBH90_053740 [Parastagonospora nodorum]